MKTGFPVHPSDGESKVYHSPKSKKRIALTNLSSSDVYKLTTFSGNLLLQRLRPELLVHLLEASVPPKQCANSNSRPQPLLNASRKWIPTRAQPHWSKKKALELKNDWLIEAGPRQAVAPLVGAFFFIGPKVFEFTLIG